MKKRIVIILGSARRNGDTRRKVDSLSTLLKCNVIDLLDYRIAQYNYGHDYRNDDFLDLVKDIFERYDTLIYATPVYWYTMSGIMKVFFDRFTDLLNIEKDTGRKLRGKNMAVLSCSNGANLGEDFWHPFIATADYLGMNYLDHVHTYATENETRSLFAFAKKIDTSIDITP